MHHLLGAGRGSADEKGAHCRARPGARTVTIRTPSTACSVALPAMTAAQPTWYYENFEISGSAIGFRVTRKLDEVQSKFQKIEIWETTDWGNLMVIDGA